MSDAALLSPKHAPNDLKAAMSEVCLPAVALKL